MADRMFTQKELDCIVAARLARERQRLAREFENSLKRCMASVHLAIHQELLCVGREQAAGTEGPLRPGGTDPANERPANPAQTQAAPPTGGGEGK